jgi:hypothetical protein
VKVPNPDALTVVAWNTHVGVGILNGGLTWLIGETNPDVLLLSEVGRPVARAALRARLNPAVWKIVGNERPSWGRGATGTMIVTRRSRLRFLNGSNTLVSPYLDRMHPQRRTTVGWYVDKLTGARVTLSSMHTWTLVGLKTAPEKRHMIKPGHMMQVQRYAAHARNARAQGDLVVFGGDVNERVNGDGTQPVEEAMRNAGMVLTRPWTDRTDSLDDIWRSAVAGARAVKSANYRRLTVPGKGIDHRAIVVDVWP